MITRETKQPRDYEVMDSVLDRGDAVELARHLSCSPQLIRGWCRAPETESEFASGKFGPLSRLRTLIAMVREDDGCSDRAYPIGRYIANLLGGIFVPMPQSQKSMDSGVIKNISSVLKETGDAVEVTRKVWFDETPGRISNKERAACVAEIDEAMVSLVHLRQWIETNSKKR